MLMFSGFFKTGSLEGFFSFLVWYLNKYLNNSLMFKYPPNIQRWKIIFFKNLKFPLLVKINFNISEEEGKVLKSDRNSESFHLMIS